MRGVFTYKNGDRYQGEYLDNDMEGYGVYTWQSGTVYRGKWKESMMDGCGVKMVKQSNGKILLEEGEFNDDEWKGITRRCRVKDARKAAAEADKAAQMASSFQLDGEFVSLQSSVSHLEATNKKSMMKGGPFESFTKLFKL